MPPQTEYDIAIAGSGIAGMAAGIEAARAGARVLMLEKDVVIGGSARWAYGFDLENYTFAEMRANDPEGDPVLQRALVEDFEASIAWLRECGVELEEEEPGRFVYRPNQGDGGLRAFTRLRKAFELAGGTLRTSTFLSRLDTDEYGAITGLVARGAAGTQAIHCRSVILATGSFGRNIEMKVRYLGPNGERTGFYGSRFHDGDGIIAGLAIGAGLSTGFSIPTGVCVFPPPFVPPDGVSLLGATGPMSSEPVPRDIQTLLIRPPVMSDPSILINLEGERYVSEAARYTVVGWKTTMQTLGVGFCIFDKRVFAAEQKTLELAAKYGAAIYSENAIADLAGGLKAWRATRSYADGVNAERMIATLDAYNLAARSGHASGLYPPARTNALPLDEPPFYAVPVVQGIPDMVGGLLIDGRARVLDRSEDPIRGLYAAGADAGRAYAVEHGGLSFGLIIGRIAGRSAAAFSQEVHL